MTGLTFEIESHPERGYIRIRVRGRLTAPETRETRTRAIADHPGLNRLWDFEEADLTAWSGDDMRMFIDVLKRCDPSGPVVKVAALVRRDVDFGLIRMFESLSIGALPGQFGTFRDEAQAVQWVSRGTDP